MSIDDLFPPSIEQTLARMSVCELTRLRDLVLNEMMLRQRDQGPASVGHALGMYAQQHGPVYHGNVFIDPDESTILRFPRRP